MRITILTLFKENFDGIINSSIIKRAVEKKIVDIEIIDYREFSDKANKRVDDYSYGGGAGMIIQLQPVLSCLKSIEGYEKAHKIITSPIGYKYDQKKAVELSKKQHLIIVCGHYEGIDYRINEYMDEEISIGDYILTGGEIASLAILDSVVRLLDGALGNEMSSELESFGDGLLEYPQYTRPVEYDGKTVPEVLVSGNHENIRIYRRYMQLKLTYENRIDLLENAILSEEDKQLLELIKNKKPLIFNKK